LIKAKLLTAAEEIELSRRAAKGDQSAINELVRANQGLVWYMARKKLDSNSPDFDDLISAGNIGLLEAVRDYDPDSGNRFSTYATFKVYHQMNVQMRIRAKLHIPARVWCQLRQFELAVNVFASKGEMHPTDEQVAELLGITSQEVVAIRKSIQALGCENRTIHDTWEMDQFDQPVFSLEWIEKAKEAIEGLDLRSRALVEMRFGLNGQSPKTLHEVGERFNVSRERIRQLQKRAMEQIGKAVTGDVDFELCQ